jgi:hypothetical protein
MKVSGGLGTESSGGQDKEIEVQGKSATSSFSQDETSEKPGHGA